MAESEPTTLKVKEPGGSVRFDEVRVHREIETDKAGLSRMHVWVTARAEAHDEDPFVSLVVNVAFSLFDKERHVGIVTAHGVTFERHEQSEGVTADSGLYLDVQDSITQVEAQIETTKVIRGSTKLVFENV